MCIHQIEPPLDAFYPILKTVDPTLDDVEALFHSGQANLHVMKVVDYTIHLGVHAPKQHQNNVIGFVSHPPYSAAIEGTAPSEVDDQVYWSMRASMTSRKLRIRPCTGQAAASPRAQMV